MLVDRTQHPAALTRQHHLLAQSADMGVHRSRVHVAAEIPNIFQQRGSADDTTVATEQVGREIKFAVGEIDQITVQGDGAFVDVKFVGQHFLDPSTAAARGRICNATPTQDGLDTVSYTHLTLPTSDLV